MIKLRYSFNGQNRNNPKTCNLEGFNDKSFRDLLLDEQRDYPNINSQYLVHTFDIKKKSHHAIQVHQNDADLTKLARPSLLHTWLI